MLDPHVTESAQWPAQHSLRFTPVRRSLVGQALCAQSLLVRERGGIWYHVLCKPSLMLCARTSSLLCVQADASGHSVVRGAH